MDIICTISNSLFNPEDIDDLVGSGADILRINCSYTMYDEKYIEKLEEIIGYIKTNYPHIKVMFDLQGKKIRVANLINYTFTVARGDKVLFCSETYFVNNKKRHIRDILIPLTYYDELIKNEQFDVILADDASMKFNVLRIYEDKELIETETVYGGTLKKNRGINIPGLSRDDYSLTHKDKQDVKFGLKNNIDIFALSYCSSDNDVMELKKYITKFIKESNVLYTPEIYAKIENEKGINNYKDILRRCNGIIIGRGELKAEMEPIEATIKQEEIINYMKKSRKELIIGTNVLNSMIHSFLPSINDAQGIIYLHKNKVDGILLSEEITLGKYPSETIKYIKYADGYLENN
ncbi:pyruvate kinase [Clostridium sp.]|uniref:pyruvate kinase n=1 Tax=Clostridium sp. TaxID=1506 RepID=UPI001B7B48E6|nr:pyruvate kinase [Clostridium sp.]MBP3915686.1 hypothetical protein [Clostridium sp.]